MRPLEQLPLEIEKLVQMIEERQDSESEPSLLSRRLQGALTKLFEPRITPMLKIVETLTSEKYETSLKLKEIETRMSQKVDKNGFNNLV